jgi:hypothetical protein
MRVLSTSKIKLLPRWRSAALVAILAFLLTAAQVVLTQHYHDDHTRHAECALCLKQGKESDAAINASFSASFIVGFTADFIYNFSTPASGAFSANARAPPHSFGSV